MSEIFLEKKSFPSKNWKDRQNDKLWNLYFCICYFGIYILQKHSNCSGGEISCVMINKYDLLLYDNSMARSTLSINPWSLEGFWTKASTLNIYIGVAGQEVIDVGNSTSRKLEKSFSLSRSLLQTVNKRTKHIDINVKVLCTFTSTGWMNMQQQLSDIYSMMFLCVSYCVRCRYFTLNS